MAEKNIQMQRKTATGYDKYYPKTKAGLVEFADGTTVEAHKADGASHAKTARFVVGTSTAGWTAKDCHYLCDGVGDQAEINAAISALPSSGGEIIILDGIYNITSRIDVSKSNTVIRGKGKNTVLLRKFNSPSNPQYLIGPTANDITIRDITIDGNVSAYSGQYNGGVGTTNQNNHRFQVINVTLIDILDSGIAIRGDNSVIRDCTCVNCKFGIYTGFQRDVLIIGNILKDCDIGIRLAATKSGIVSNNICVRGLGTPEDYTSIQNTILLYGSSNTNLLISSNHCMGKAPVVEGGTGNTVFNNKWNESSDFEDLRNVLSGSSLPTPSSTYRGKIYILLGGAGVGDYPFVCLKKSDGSYAWVNLFTAMYSSST